MFRRHYRPWSRELFLRVKKFFNLIKALWLASDQFEVTFDRSDLFLTHKSGSRLRIDDKDIILHVSRDLRLNAEHTYISCPEDFTYEESQKTSQALVQEASKKACQATLPQSKIEGRPRRNCSCK